MRILRQRHGGRGRRILRSLTRKAEARFLVTGRRRDRWAILDSYSARTSLMAVPPLRKPTTSWGARSFSSPGIPGLANRAEALSSIKTAILQLSHIQPRS